MVLWLICAPIIILEAFVLWRLVLHYEDRIVAWLEQLVKNLDRINRGR